MKTVVHRGHRNIPTNIRLLTKGHFTPPMDEVPFGCYAVIKPNKT